MSNNNRKNPEKKQTSIQKEPEDEMTPDIQDRLVNDCVLVIMSLGRNKGAIKKAEICKKVGVDKKHTKIILDLAKNKLNEILGMDIIDLELKSQCLLVSCLPKGLKLNVASVTTQDFEYTLLMIILSCIMMKDEELMNETDIKEMLDVIGVQIDNDANHAVLGNPKKLMKKFVSQHYLKHVPMTGTPQNFGFGWGLRALHEINKMNLLTAVSEVFGVTAQSWEVVYSKVAPPSQQEPVLPAAPVAAEPAQT